MILAEAMWYNYLAFTGPLYQQGNWGREQLKFVQQFCEVRELRRGSRSLVSKSVIPAANRATSNIQEICGTCCN